jgi:N-methylhydantoinase B
MTGNIDPVLLSVLQGRLEQIADEMDATLFRAAFNPIIAEAHDASHGFYDAETGDTLVQGKTGLPVFVGAMAFAVRAVIDYTRVHGPAEPGDVFIFNDPYVGGTHLNDFRLVQPVFNGDELFCYMASVAHWHDVGGNVPGNYNPSATESFQEGMCIPVVKLVAAGVERPDIVDIISANSRLPLSVYGDLNGQRAALVLGEKRLKELIVRYGAATLRDVFIELRNRAAQQMRAYIAALPDGRYEAEDYLDNDGIVDVPLKIKLAAIIAGDTMTLDFSGSAAACAGPVNISRATTEASIYVGLKHIFRDVAANAGVLEPITIQIPENSLLDAHPPRPLGGYTETILRIIDVLFVALSEIVPEKSNGCAYGTINALSIAGNKPDGARWVMFSFFGGGHGGHPAGDGLSHGNAPISMATIPPVEILESRYPVVFRQWALRPDSGGPGMHRGGLGAIYEIEVLSDAVGFLFGERGRFAPPGVVGGRPGAVNEATFIGPGGNATVPPMASKMTGVGLPKGARVRLESPGGGGYGDPFRRDPNAVARDVAAGLVSRESAQSAYGVILDEAGQVNAAATDAARSQAARP